MTDILNALIIIANFIIVPGLAYGSQLALGALGVSLVFVGALRVYLFESIRVYFVVSIRV